MAPTSRWAVAAESIRAQHPTVLVAVVEHEGSVPGTTGTTMVVTPDATAGTVGGGLAEHTLIETARFNPIAQLLPYFHDGETTDSVCSGRQLTALLPLTSQDLPSLDVLAEIERTGGVGTVVLQPTGLEASVGDQRATSFTRSDESWRFQMPVGHLDTLTIAGGGHVSLALSRVMTTLPFRVVVIDDREDLPTMANNQCAHSKHCVDWTEVGDYTAQGPHAWAVIMTQGHRHDAEVLRRLINHDLKYLGMMGSATKVWSVFAKLENEGIPRTLLDRVHAPIGLPIASHTPEEIAISIAAEIIKIRNGRES